MASEPPWTAEPPTAPGFYLHYSEISTAYARLVPIPHPLLTRAVLRGWGGHWFGPLPAPFPAAPPGPEARPA